MTGGGMRPDERESTTMAKRDGGRQPVRQSDEPFMFVGEALALDLVNTEVVARGQRRDLLATPAALAAWWDAARRHYPHDLAVERDVPTDDASFRHAVTALRTALRGLFSALAEGATPPPQHLAT